MEKARKHPLISSFDGPDQPPICEEAYMRLKTVREYIEKIKELKLRCHLMAEEGSDLAAHLLVQPPPSGQWRKPICAFTVSTPGTSGDELLDHWGLAQAFCRMHRNTETLINMPTMLKGLRMFGEILAAFISTLAMTFENLNALSKTERKE